MDTNHDHATGTTLTDVRRTRRRGMAPRGVAVAQAHDPDAANPVVSRSDQVTVERALMAVLALHTPDDRGKCPTCAPSASGWRRWRSARQRRRGGLRAGSGGAADCPTRAVLRITVLDPGTDLCTDPASGGSSAG